MSYSLGFGWIECAPQQVDDLPVQAASFLSRSFSDSGVQFGRDTKGHANVISHDTILCQIDTTTITTLQWCHIVGGAMSKHVDVTGQKFGRLLVVGKAGIAVSIGKRARRVSLWLCRCDCGAEMTVRLGNLKSGNTSSCGCQRSDHQWMASHRMSGTPTYARWRAMVQRCVNPNSNTWERYGGRGITVCERWRSFDAFYADMGDPPPGMTIERIDNDSGYSPENCRWATSTEQVRNRRVTTLLEYDGVTKPLADWADDLGVHYTVLHFRLKRGWSVEKAVTTPSMGNGR